MTLSDSKTTPVDNCLCLIRTHTHCLLTSEALEIDHDPCFRRTDRGEFDGTCDASGIDCCNCLLQPCQRKERGRDKLIFSTKSAKKGHNSVVVR